MLHVLLAHLGVTTGAAEIELVCTILRKRRCCLA